MTEIKTYTFSQLGASMASSKRPDEKVVKLQDHIKAMDNKEDVINSLWETFITIAKKLDINLEKAKNHEGNPSDVFIEYIEAQAKEIERLKSRYDSLMETHKDLMNEHVREGTMHRETINRLMEKNRELENKELANLCDVLENLRTKVNQDIKYEDIVSEESLKKLAFDELQELIK